MYLKRPPLLNIWPVCDQVEDENFQNKKQTYTELYNCSESLDNLLVSSWDLQAILKEEEDNIAPYNNIRVYFFP